MQSVCCCWWTKTTEELLPGEEKKNPPRAEQNTQEEKREWGWRRRVPLGLSPSSRFTELTVGTGSGQACLLSAFICLRPHKAVLKTVALTLFPGNLLPDTMSTEGTQSCLLLRNVFACTTSSWRHLHGCGEKGKEAKVHHFSTTWKHAKMFSHPHWFVDLHLLCKKLDCRLGGSRVKIYNPHPPTKPDLPGTPQQIWKEGKTGHRRGSVRWRTEAKGQSWSLLALPLILSLKRSLAHATSPEPFSQVNTAGMPMLSLSYMTC